MLRHLSIGREGHSAEGTSTSKVTVASHRGRSFWRCTHDAPPTTTTTTNNASRPSPGAAAPDLRGARRPVGTDPCRAVGHSERPHQTRVHPTIDGVPPSAEPGGDPLKLHGPAPQPYRHVARTDLLLCQLDIGDGDGI